MLFIESILSTQELQVRNRAVCSALCCAVLPPWWLCTSTLPTGCFLMESSFLDATQHWARHPKPRWARPNMRCHVHWGCPPCRIFILACLRCLLALPSARWGHFGAPEPSQCQQQQWRCVLETPAGAACCHTAATSHPLHLSGSWSASPVYIGKRFGIIFGWQILLLYLIFETPLEKLST